MLLLTGVSPWKLKALEDSSQRRSQMRKLVGKLLCWMGLHDWYEGVTCVYCLRTDCEESLQNVVGLGNDDD
jgi:hypothetical protein